MSEERVAPGCVTDWFTPWHLAKVREDPESFVALLVGAGVLEGRGAFYAVVQPHVHEWRVVNATGWDGNVEIRCRCGDVVFRSDNRLPIEVPDA